MHWLSSHRTVKYRQLGRCYLLLTQWLTAHTQSGYSLPRWLIWDLRDEAWAVDIAGHCQLLLPPRHLLPPPPGLLPHHPRHQDTHPRPRDTLQVRGDGGAPGHNIVNIITTTIIIIPIIISEPVLSDCRAECYRRSGGKTRTLLVHYISLAFVRSTTMMGHITTSSLAARGCSSTTEFSVGWMMVEITRAWIRSMIRSLNTSVWTTSWPTTWSLLLQVGTEDKWLTVLWSHLVT